ncbi:MAG: SMC-Scp complex subunit ScpB [Clostridia bacterium]|nr:SMC-Scp complex subunit ScpB [Clostridia bacterium]
MNDQQMPTISDIGEAIEAILFAAGYPVKYEKLSEVLGLSVKDVKLLCEHMATEYQKSGRGILMLCLPETCQLTTKEQYMPYIREALGIKRGGNLSASSLEVLAIVAYNQPVTRAYIDAVRGVDSSYAVGSLLDKNLIEACGRLDAPGRPMLYVTTDKFLRVFGLNSLSELPETEALSIAAAQADASAEAEQAQAEESPEQEPIPEGEYTEVTEDDSRAEV